VGGFQSGQILKKVYEDGIVMEMMMDQPEVV